MWRKQLQLQFSNKVSRVFEICLKCISSSKDDIQQHLNYFCVERDLALLHSPGGGFSTVVICCIFCRIKTANLGNLHAKYAKSPSIILMYQRHREFWRCLWMNQSSKWCKNRKLMKCLHIAYWIAVTSSCKSLKFE